jgi:hypothetical protein
MTFPFLDPHFGWRSRFLRTNHIFEVVPGSRE